MNLKDSNQGWNEIEFLSWEEFRRMAAPIMQLEITRISRLIDSCELEQDVHNTLVTARFHMRKFEKMLEASARESVGEQCRPPIGDAILALGTGDHELDAQTRSIIDYVLDRLNYIHMKIDYLY